MIFATVGTNEAAFDRFVAALATVAASGEEVVAQTGASTLRPEGVRCIDFLPFDRMVELMRESDTVVMHAGVGSIMVALANEKCPLVVPRRARLGEAVDDHQVELARRFEQRGLVVVVEDAADLPAEVMRGPRRAAKVADGDGELAADLRAYLRSTVGRSSAPGER